MDRPGCNKGEGLDQSWISRARRFNFRVSCLPLVDKSRRQPMDRPYYIFLPRGSEMYMFHIPRARTSSERSPRFFLSLPPRAPRISSLLPAVALARTRSPQSGVSKRNFIPPSGDTIPLPHDRRR